MVCDDFADGGEDRVAEFGVGGEAVEYGLMDGGREFVFGGGVVGICRDEEDFVLGRVSSRLFRDLRGWEEGPVD